jgi:hypothetical protein
MRMWFFWLRRRWRVALASLAIVLAAALVTVLTLGDTAFSVTLLGDANAPRAALAGEPSGTMLPRSGDATQAYSTLPDTNTSLLDAPIGADAGPQTVAQAQAAWSAAEIQQHETELLAALNCTRRQQQLPALTLDPQLSQTASEAWLKLTRDPSFSLMSLPGQYAMRSVLPLDFGAPNLATASNPAAQGDKTTLACSVGGFDAAVLPAASGARQIGIAVFPPQASWDMASAVILVK